MIVHGSDINLTALSGVKTLAELKRLNIYSHLANSNEAYAELWKILKPGSKSKLPELTEEPE